LAALDALREEVQLRAFGVSMTSNVPNFAAETNFEGLKAAVAQCGSAENMAASNAA
jgi:hypothetical protein